MEIYWEYKSRGYSINIGRNTNRWKQVYFLTIEKKYYASNGSVEYAKLLFHI